MILRKIKTYKEDWVMGSFAKKLEKMFTAVTFAEAGEFDTARQILKEETETEKSVVKSHKGIQVPATATES